MDTMPRGGLVSYLDQHGLSPTPYIDYFSQCLSFPKPVHANQLRGHAPEAWDMRKNDDSKPRQNDLLQVRSTIIKPKDAHRATGNDAATSDKWRLTAHDVLGLKDGKRVISPALRISDWMAYIKDTKATPEPGTCCIEFGLDFMEKFPQDDDTRAGLLVSLMFHLKRARGLGGIKAVNARKARTKDIKTFPHAVNALVGGYQLMIGDREQMQFKAYIKRTDSLCGKNHSPLPPNLHRARLEVRAFGKDCPITDPAQLTNLVQLASWFALLTAKDEDKAGIPYGFHGMAPTCKPLPKRRKTQPGYCSSRVWYDRIKGRFKRANLGDKKNSSKGAPTEGKLASTAPAALITSRAASSPSTASANPEGIPAGPMAVGRLRLSPMPLATKHTVAQRHHFVSSANASLSTFDTRPNGTHISIK